MSYYGFGWGERGAALASRGPARAVAAVEGAAAVFHKAFEKKEGG